MSKTKNNSFLADFYGEQTASFVERLFSDDLLTYKRNFRVYTEDDKTYVLTLALPGFKPTDLVVEVYEGILTVTAKKDNASVKNSVYIGIRIDEDKTEASLEDGILTIKVVKAQEVTKKRIVVK